MNFNHVVRIGPDHFVAKNVLNGAEVASARRSGEGNLWIVRFHRHGKSGLARNETPHVRVSGKLPKHVQIQILRSLLEGAG